MFIILIPVYVFLNIQTHFPPLPYTYTFIVTFMFIVCVMFYTYNHVFASVDFLLFPKLERHLCYGIFYL